MPPLHSLPHSAAQITRMLSLIPTVTNCRDRHGQRCARRFRTPEAAMLRISASQQYGRETSSGQGNSNSPRDCVRARPAIAPRGSARCKPPALSVRSVISAPPPLRALIAADRNDRTHFENQIRPRPRRWTSRPAGLGCRERQTRSRPSFRYVPSAGTR